MKNRPAARAVVAAGTLAMAVIGVSTATGAAGAGRKAPSAPAITVQPQSVTV